jgi:hypothetical protein
MLIADFSAGEATIRGNPGEQISALIESISADA